MQTINTTTPTREPAAIKSTDIRSLPCGLTERQMARLLNVVAQADYNPAPRAKATRMPIWWLARRDYELLPPDGLERVIILTTHLLTGLRGRELADLSVHELDLTEGAECIRMLDDQGAQGAERVIPIPTDLAADFRMWLPPGKRPNAGLFSVSTMFLENLNRDLKAAGLSKRASEIVPWAPR